MKKEKKDDKKEDNKKKPAEKDAGNDVEMTEGQGEGEETTEAEPEVVEEEIWQQRRDLRDLYSGNPVKIVLFEEDCFKMVEVCGREFRERPDLFKNLTLGFADPPWGVNKNSTQMGGIDLLEEKWGK